MIITSHQMKRMSVGKEPCQKQVLQEELISKYFGRCLFSGADETRILGVATDKEVIEPTQGGETM